MGCRVHYHKMDWARWASDSILGARARHEVEAEDVPPEPQMALAPASAVKENPFEVRIEEPTRQDDGSDDEESGQE